MDFQTPPVVVKPIEGGFRIVLSGPIHTNTSWLERELDDVVNRKPALVELDLGRSEYVSSTGLGIFVSLHNRLAAGGGSLSIVRILPRTRAIFRASALDRLFRFAPDALVSTEAT
jgi:anti-anti-sigma factor